MLSLKNLPRDNKSSLEEAKNDRGSTQHILNRHISVQHQRGLGESVQNTSQSLRTSQLDETELDRTPRGKIEQSSTVVSEKTARFYGSHERISPKGSQQIRLSKNSLLQNQLNQSAAKMAAAANYDQRSSSFSVDLVSNKMGQVTILTSNENPSDFRYFDNLGSKNLF